MTIEQNKEVEIIDGVQRDNLLEDDIQQFVEESIINAMRQHGVTQVIIFPSDEYEIMSQPEFCAILPIDIRKATTPETEPGIVMNRLGIVDNKLMYHGSDFDYWVDDDLDFSILKDEELDEPWSPISEFQNLSGLLKITSFLLTKDCAWQYTADHPEELIPKW